MDVYGSGNEERMTGYETASFDKFSHGIVNRESLVRIERIIKMKKVILKIDALVLIAILILLQE